MHPLCSGGTDPAYAEFDASANADDGSCATLNPTCVEPSFDGYSYSVVEIGDQCWFAENLRSTILPKRRCDSFRHGGRWNPPLLVSLQYTARAAAPAPRTVLRSMLATKRSPWGSMAACTIGTRGRCAWPVPERMACPTDGEWTDLENYITSQGFSGTEGTAFEVHLWMVDGGNGTDDFGFSALPGGYRFTQWLLLRCRDSATGGVLRPVAALLGTGT